MTGFPPRLGRRGALTVAAACFVVCVGVEALEVAPPVADGDAAPTAAGSITPGMQIDAVRTLLGRAPDATERLGIGCGFIDVSQWDELPFKVISVDGRVRSVVPADAPDLPAQ